MYFQKNMYVLCINKAITEKMPNKKSLMLDKPTDEENTNVTSKQDCSLMLRVVDRV